MRPEGKKIPPPKLLITTNLDNDDAFSSDVVELLQRELRPAPGKRIYSLLYGYQYFTDRRFALKMRYTNNHFLTLAEPFDAHTETIISYRHTKAIRQLPTTYLSTARGKWLEIVHEDNVSNDSASTSKSGIFPCSTDGRSPISVWADSASPAPGSGRPRCSWFRHAFLPRRYGVCAASGRNNPFPA